MAILERYTSSAGSATNGGSSEGAAKQSGTGWTAVTTTVTANNIGASPVAVNDLVYLASSTGGYNTKWFKITGITSDNVVSVHAAPGAGNASYVWAVGGALDLVTTLAVAQPGDRWNIKADGTYSHTTATLSNATQGTGQASIFFRGYKTTIGDGYLGRSNVSGALTTTNFAVITFTSGKFTLGSGLHVECLSITASACGALMVSMGANSTICHCSCTNNYTGANAPNALGGNSSNTLYFNCDVSQPNATATGSAALYMYANSVAYACRVTAAGIGIYSVTAGNVVFGCFVYNSAYGIQPASGVTFMVINNTIYNCSVSGLSMKSYNYAQAVGFIAINNLVTDCARSIESLYYGTANLSIIEVASRKIRAANADRGISADCFQPYLINTTAGNDFVSAGNDARLLSTSPAIDNGIWGFDIGAGQRPEDYPAVADVKDSVFYNTSSNEGTYTGPAADYPAVTDVRDGVFFNNSNSEGTLNIITDGTKILTGYSQDNGAVVGSATAETHTADQVISSAGGNYHEPERSEVWNGVVFGLTTGTKRASSIVNCSDVNIKDGVTIDDVTGTYNNEAHTADQVIKSAGGNYEEAGATNVRFGTPTGLTTGTLDIISDGTKILTGNSQDNGAVVGSAIEESHTADQVIDSAGGNYIRPAVTDVRNLVPYGTSSTGSLDVYAEANLPTEDNVIESVSYGNSQTGTYRPPNNDYYVSIAPQYGPNATITGNCIFTFDFNNYVSESYTNYGPSGVLNGAYINPSPDDLRVGTSVGNPTNFIVGLLDLPATTDVKDGVFYDNNTKEGSLVVGGGTPVTNIFHTSMIR